MSRYIPQAVKFELMLRSRGCCEDCGTRIGAAEIDHAFIPYSLGGPNEAWNLRVRCRRCNRTKGAKMGDITVHVNDLYQHQQDVHTALDVYPFRGPLPEHLEDCAIKPIAPDLDGVPRNAALVWMVTAGGKTRAILARAFTQLKRARATRPEALVLLVGHTTATVGRFAEEFDKVQSPPAGKPPLVTGESVPSEIVTLSGDSPGIAFSTLQYGGAVAIMVSYLLNRIREAKKQKISSDWMDNVVALHIDEGGHYGAETWATIASAFRNAEVTYWSGTPIRHDKELLPGVPYGEKREPDSNITEYTLYDVARVTQIQGARYTLAQANFDGRIKQIDPGPPIQSARYTDAVDPVATGGLFEGENLEDLKAKAAARDLAVRPFKDDLAIVNLLQAALSSFRELVRKYEKPGMKLTAIVQAAYTRDADRICRLARAVGWNAVVYYSPKEDDPKNDEVPVPSATMEDNLRRFEDPQSPVNMCVQVNCLTEGYDNKAIVMAILACTAGSYARLQQFFGRVLRLTKGPRLPAIFWSLNVQPNRRMIDEYCRAAVDLTFTVREGVDPPPPGNRRDEIGFDAASWVCGDGRTWQEIAAEYDLLEQRLKSTYGPFVSPENWEAFKATYVQQETHATSSHKVVPDNIEEAVKRYLDICKDLRSYLTRNAQDEITRDVQERKRIIGTIVQTIIGRFYPGLKGGVVNNRQGDPVQLAQLLSDYDEDPNQLKNACMHKLKTWK